MLILGLSPFRHHAAAALLQDGVICAAVENDKLLRAHKAGLPEAAISFCLERIGARWSDLTSVAVAARPAGAWLRRSRFGVGHSGSGSIAVARYPADSMGNPGRELKEIQILRQQDGLRHRISNFDHHLCHAASAFFSSPFDRALIIILDEEGDGYSGMIGIGLGGDIRVVRRIRFPGSLALIYSMVTELVGFVAHREEHKTQWLSLEGEPKFKRVFLNMLRRPLDLVPFLEPSFVERNAGKGLSFSAKFYRQIGIPKGQPPGEEHCRALASSVQEACTEIVADLAEDLRHQYGIQYVCLGGGFFQNALLVASIEKKLGLNQVFVPPAPGNAGTAVGAAQLCWHVLLGRQRQEPAWQVYSGPRFTGQEVKNVLDNSKSLYRFQDAEENKLEIAIQFLKAGKIVAWVQGSCEFGPRALGNRSVLASPWAPYVRENLNDYIKFREWFRPFAIAVPEEDCHKYFDCSYLCRFMNSLGWTRANSGGLPGSFMLPGGRVRLHVVERQSNPLFWRLLKRFGDHAPAPMLINTSFNLFGEPLVVTPRDAIRSYYCSGIDALVIDNFVLSKAGIPPVLAPVLGESLGVSA
jgi:carbamoyltransferase